MVAGVLGAPSRACAAGTGQGRAAQLAVRTSQVCDGEDPDPGDGWD